MNIFNDFETLDLINLDEMIWDDATGASLSCNSGAFLSLIGSKLYLVDEAGNRITDEEGNYILLDDSTIVEFYADRVLGVSSGSFALTGTDLTLTKVSLTNYSLECSSGDIDLIGTDVDLKVSRLISASSGSYTSVGTDVSFRHDRLITLSIGEFSLSGTDLTLTKVSLTNYSLECSSGEVSFSGSSLSFFVYRKIQIENGSFLTSDPDVQILRSYNLSVSSGLFNLTGSSVNLSNVCILPIDSASFSVSGKDILLSAYRNISIDYSDFLFSGTDVDLIINRLLPVESGSFSGSYKSVGLKKRFNLSIQHGEISQSENDVNLLVNRKIATIPYSGILTGSGVNLVYTPKGFYEIKPDSIEFTSLGTNINLIYDHIITINNGNIIMDGTEIYIQSSAIRFRPWFLHNNNTPSINTLLY